MLVTGHQASRDPYQWTVFVSRLAARRSRPTQRLTSIGVEHQILPIGNTTGDDVTSLSRLSRKFGDRHSLVCRRVEKCAVTSDHDDVWIANSVGSREVDRVIPTQSMKFGQLTSPTSERIIELDKIDLLEHRVEVSDGVAEMPRGDAAKSLGLSESSACLRVDQPHAHNPIRAVPEQRGTGGAGLGDQQWHNC
jgi:hypothetical protein